MKPTIFLSVLLSLVAVLSAASIASYPHQHEIPQARTALQPVARPKRFILGAALGLGAAGLGLAAGAGLAGAGIAGAGLAGAGLLGAGIAAKGIGFAAGYAQFYHRCVYYYNILSHLPFFVCAHASSEL